MAHHHHVQFMHHHHSKYFSHPFKIQPLNICNGVREFMNQSAASAASPDYVKFQAVIKSAASAASLAEAALAADLITAFFSQILATLAAKKYKNSQNLGLCLQKWVLSKSQKFQQGFVDHPSPVFVTANPFSRYLAPLGAKLIEKI